MMSFEIFGFWTLTILAVIGFLFLPMWLWLFAYLLKNFRALILDFRSIIHEWLTASANGFMAIFYVVVTGQYEKPEKDNQRSREP